MTDDCGLVFGEINDGGREMSGSGTWSAAARVCGSQKQGTIFGEKIFENGVIRNAAADSFEMVIIKVVKIWIFG